MRIMAVAIAASAALAVGWGGAWAMTSEQPRPSRRARAASTAPLLPLSERDLTSTRETGCTCTFDVRDRSLVQMVGNELMLRTRAGRQVCRITDAQFQTLAGTAGRATCGGVQMRLRRTGRTRSFPASDSSSTPASLTVTQGRTSRTLSGSWGCAC